ncbi:MAG: OmpA family protein [Chitinophagaceae bacterium]
MKKNLAILLAIIAFIPVASFGQDTEKKEKEKVIRPAALGVSFFMNDFTTAQLIRSTSLSRVLNNKQWTKFSKMTPGIAVSYFKGLGTHVDFAGTLAGSFVRYPLPNRVFSSDKFLLEGDASLNFKMVSEAYWVQPYIIAGVGASMYGGSYFGAFIPLGLGMKLNLYDDAHVFVTSQYRVPVTTETSNYHFFYQLGIAGRIGKKKEPELKPLPPPPPPADTDKDGIIDTEDKCPTVPGLQKYQGCPVPDTDKDGINDEEDKCPSVAGLARYQGCPIPDTDKDGINDEEDKCPTQPGPASNQGCPLVDTDKDGIPDQDDRCPTLFGTVENHGCPEIKEEVVKRVDYAAQNIYFATGKYVLLSKSFKGLDEVAQIIKDNPDVKMMIDGHTDDVGSEESNQKLSENRANAVKAYLIKKGVDESRLVAAGHGESEPVADNKTAAGRQTNRRVEMKLGY